MQPHMLNILVVVGVKHYYDVSYFLQLFPMHEVSIMLPG